MINILVYTFLVLVLLIAFAIICLLSHMLFALFDVGYFLKRLFAKRVWKETKRELIRREERIVNGFLIDIENYDVYAVYEEDLVFGDKRIREEYKLRSL